MPKIVLSDVTKRWGNFYAVDHLNLVIDDCSFVTLLGPSGCGKTTILRMIAGLETPTSGKITIGDNVVFDSEKGINVPANKRKVGFLFQNYALWPNMTVYQNISFGLANVKEEMPLFAEDVKINRRIAEILEEPQAIVEVYESCRDKDGKTDVKRLQIKMIDAFEISMMTAKEIISLKIPERASEVLEIKEKYAQKAQAAVDKLAQEGITLGEECEKIKDGQVLKSVRKLTKEEIDLTVRRVSRLVKIGMFMERYPAELSGGQQQRVAIARTLAPQPSILFMDEPLSNLDAKLRLEMRSELQRLHITTDGTFVYVTHDQMEAMTLATKICLIENGVLQQYDAPLDVYNTPNNLFVADFVGNPSINFVEVVGKQNGDMIFTGLEGRRITYHFNQPLDMKEWRVSEQKVVDEEKAALEQARASRKYVEKSNKNTVFKYNIMSVDDEVKPSDETEDSYVLGVRPEAIKISETDGVEAEIYSAMPTGMETTVRLRIGNLLLTGIVFGGITYDIGQKVKVIIDGKNVMLFSRKTGRFISNGSVTIE